MQCCVWRLEWSLHTKEKSADRSGSVGVSVVGRCQQLLLKSVVVVVVKVDG